MSQQMITHVIKASLEKLLTEGLITQMPANYQINATKDKSHGDFACNVALILAKMEQKPPREMASLIQNYISPNSAISKIEIAGPGFINFFLTNDAIGSVVKDILAQKEKYGYTNEGAGKKIHIEFVSANPNGPLHVGHGRHAAYGAVVAALLETQGYEIYREYYVNDAGRQMDIVTTSTWLRYLELLGDNISFPANGYKGLYVIEIAKKLHKQQANSLKRDPKELFEDLPLDEPFGGDKEIYIDALIERVKKRLGGDYETVFNLVLEEILKDIRNDLEEFGVEYQNWFSEKAFVESSVVQDNLDALKALNLIYEQDNALWFRSTEFGDEKDRVLQRSNGIHTYFANDFAYHINKFTRGFDHVIDIFGADHHGYIPRMKAGLKARGISPEKLTYLLVQFVTLYRGKEQVQMSTRSGSFITLRELREEVGNDAARFFYVMRKCEQHIDFDLELAKSKTNENPVYYIQYAHARICSVFRQLADKGLTYIESSVLSCLDSPEELQLMGRLGRYAPVLKNAADQHEPHILTNYLRDLATDFHAYYNKHQFLVEEADTRHARLTLILAVRQILQNGLKLLGVTAPQNM